MFLTVGLVELVNVSCNGFLRVELKADEDLSMNCMVCTWEHSVVPFSQFGFIRPFYSFRRWFKAVLWALWWRWISGSQRVFVFFFFMFIFQTVSRKASSISFHFFSLWGKDYAHKRCLTHKYLEILQQCIIFFRYCCSLVLIWHKTFSLHMGPCLLMFMSLSLLKYLPQGPVCTELLFPFNCGLTWIIKD